MPESYGAHPSQYVTDNSRFIKTHVNAMEHPSFHKQVY